MPVFNNALAGAAGSGGAAAYEIERSLRFNDEDSAYLDREPSSAGNTKTWTFSCWVKRSEIGSIYPALLSAGANSQVTGFFQITIENDEFSVYMRHSSGTNYAYTNAKLRDTSAWYHLVVALDTTAATEADRLKMYVNGVEQTFRNSSIPGPDRTFLVNDTAVHQIGATKNSAGTTNAFYAGYMAEVHLVDGQALDETSFGEFDANTGVWNPIKFTGSHGTNGFHLDFSNTSSTTSGSNAGIGKDVSGNGNYWDTNSITASGTGTAYRTLEISENNTPSVVQRLSNAWDATYIATYVNTSTWAITNTAWLGTDGFGNNELRWIPAGGYAVSSSLRVYFGVYSNVSRSTTLTVTYTDGTTESSSQFTSSIDNWMTLFTASNAANKTIQKVELSNPDSTNLQFGGFVIDDQIVTSLNTDTDSFIDSPTNGTQSDTGAGGEVSGNYCTWNPLSQKNATLSNGNLDCSLSTGTTSKARATIAVTSGKYYWEITFKSGGFGVIGISDASISDSEVDFNSGVLNYYVGTGGLYGDVGGSFSNTSYGSALAANDVLGIALDMDNGNVKFLKNNSDLGNANTSSLIGKTIMPHIGEGGGATFVTEANFGARSFIYSAPTGFKSLCTANLDDPTIANSSQEFDVKLWNGTGGAGGTNQTITGINFEPQFVWIKNRDASEHHVVFDQIRQAQNVLYPSLSGAESAQSNGLISFTPDGFELGTDGKVNANLADHVGWVWNSATSTSSNSNGSIISDVRANTTAGFSIVSYTGNGGASATIGHGLNAAPEMIMVKNRDVGDEGVVYHVGTDATSPQSYNLKLFSSTAGNVARDSGLVMWNNTAPTSSVFSVGTPDNVNASTEDYIAYCWHSVEGYSLLTSFVGNGDPDGPFVYTGFRPAFIMLKNVTVETTSSNWAVFDTKREGYNVDNDPLYANKVNAEATTDMIDILSNGFKMRSTLSYNTASSTIIVAAFAENPFKTARAR